MNGDLISRNTLLGMEKLLWNDAFESSKEARVLYEQVIYDIEHVPGATYIPTDFDGKVFEQNIVGDNEVAIIWFDEDKWTVEQIIVWHKVIEKFCSRPLLMLPKSFSYLEVLSSEQLLTLKQLVDNTIAKLGSDTNE